MKKSQKRYLQVFGIVVVVLAFVRAVGGGVRSDLVTPPAAKDSIDLSDSLRFVGDSAGGYSPVGHPVRGVRSYTEAFPDTNDLQLSAALQHGIAPIPTRAAVPQHTNGGRQLVYVGSSPFFYVDSLARSVPYLVPRAASLLHDMGRVFMDSLRVKQVPLHRLIVSSVLRTKEDVERLRGNNRNATENSCHLYGTTFDISYNRYKAVAACDTCGDRAQSDTLKRVLSEVLRDMREGGRCYVKHERKQGCFHITVK